MINKEKLLKQLKKERKLIVKLHKDFMCFTNVDGIVYSLKNNENISKENEEILKEFGRLAISTEGNTLIKIKEYLQLLDDFICFVETKL